jgi:hypothetical protein
MGRVPEISRFLGIVITMRYREHAPPHFHAAYGGRRASLAIDPIVVLKGRLPGRVLGLVVEWASEHQSELMENWGLAKRKETLRRISPLEE